MEGCALGRSLRAVAPECQEGLLVGDQNENKESYTPYYSGRLKQFVHDFSITLSTKSASEDHALVGKKPPTRLEWTRLVCGCKTTAHGRRTRSSRVVSPTDPFALLADRGPNVPVEAAPSPATALPGEAAEPGEQAPGTSDDPFAPPTSHS